MENTQNQIKPIELTEEQLNIKKKYDELLQHFLSTNASKRDLEIRFSTAPHRNIIDLLYKLYNFTNYMYNNYFYEENGSETKGVIRDILIKSGHTVFAVHLTLDKYLERDAAMLCRSLLELNLNVMLMFEKDTETRINLYKDFFFVLKYKEYKRGKLSLEGEEEKITLENYEKYKENYKPNNPKSWCWLLLKDETGNADPTQYDIAKHIGGHFFETFHDLYGVLSLAVHANVASGNILNMADKIGMFAMSYCINIYQQVIQYYRIKDYEEITEYLNIFLAECFPDIESKKRDTKEHVYNNVKLYENKNNAITLITINDISIEDYIKDNTPLIDIRYNVYFPHNHEIILPEEYVNFYYDYLKANLLIQDENQRFAADLASHMYALMTIYWQDLLRKGEHLKGILFWKHILKITLDWESKNKAHIHKGSLYGYIAFTFLAMGDSYSGFSYLNCALADDILIGKLAPSLDYPDKAPCNLTISLNTSVNNFMQPFVTNVKAYLQSYMESYKKENPKFDISSFDSMFLENKDFIHLKIYFVYCIWSLFDNINKYEFYYTQNTFNKQTNLISLFNLSLVLDNVLSHYQTKNNEQFNKPVIMFGDRVKKYVETSKMNISYYVESKDKYYNMDLDKSLPELLKEESDLRKKEVNYLLTSLLLRNFVAHKIEPQEISFTYFKQIIGAQIYSLIMILKFYN